MLASPLDPGGDTAVIARFGAISDVATILDALSLGQHLNFQLEDETETLVRFHLANDMEFKRLYDVSAERIASTRIAHGVVRSQVSQPSRPTFSQLADRARQNPTGHAIWMVEPEPRDYQVWLVHLDASGTKMADSWTLNTFNNRREQGAYGLDVARDLRIKLIDVVDNK